MGKVVNARQAALAQARQRRLELDAARDERDRRVEEAVADVLVLVQTRAVAELEVNRANEDIGEALRRLLAEDLNAEQVAGLVAMDVTEVRRLCRPSPRPAVDGSTVRALSRDEPSEGEDARRRVG